MKFRVASASAVALLLSACSTITPLPAILTADAGAAAVGARSLDDAGLRRFLSENTGQAPGGAWDFESLSWVAFYYHPSLAVARAQWATSLATRQTAAARPNPTVSLTPGYDSTHQAGISPWFPAVNFDLLLLNSKKRTHQQAIAAAESESARLAVVSAAWRVRSDLRHALVDASFGAQREKLLGTQLDAQKKVLALLEQRLAVGRIAAHELSTARSALVKAEAAAADARTQSAAARARVAAALGLPVSALAGVTLPSAPVGPALSSEALAAASRESLQSRADVRAALAHYEATQAALALETAKQQPDLHLGPGYQWDQGLNKWSLALTFELPIFQRNEGPIAEAVAHRAEAAAQFTSVQTQVVSAVDLAVAAQTSAVQQSEHAARYLMEIKRQTESARRRLELGASDQLEYQSALVDVSTAELASVDAANALALAAGQLEDALQVPFPHLAALADAARPTAALVP